ncbi:unnamed protein product, partial [Tetraodon nigroviridis]
MIWLTFFTFLAPCVLGNKTAEQVPFFHGHVFENSSPGSRVNGLSVPMKRLNSQALCEIGDSDAAAAQFRLLGDGSENFRVFAHHKRGHVLLKTRWTFWTPTTTNPFSLLKLLKLSLDDATALRTSVYAATARDGDSGKNAELIYFTVPRNGSFYAVPKTGDILLVDSILGQGEPIKFKLFARDRGWPPRTSRCVSIEINPRQWPVTLPEQMKWELKSSLKRPERKSRSVMPTESPIFMSVSEDAGIGSVVMNLNPVRFQSAAFELVEPEAESSPVSVGRESGDIIISRKLDRETEPLVGIAVKIQDKR